MNPENLTKAIHDAAFLLSDLHAAQNDAAASHPEIAALLEELWNQACEIKYRLHKIVQALP
ncbi:MAG TPA: hypothetical protein P5330_11200 [Candidatus Competibacteraceae bacterium]|nr:hypothetical protein [Candidatus Competibacteraceae bacterium]